MSRRSERILVGGLGALGLVLIVACSLAIAFGDGGAQPRFVVGLFFGVLMLVWSLLVERPSEQKRRARPRRMPAHAPDGGRESIDEDDDDDSLLAIGAAALLAQSEGVEDTVDVGDDDDDHHDDDDLDDDDLDDDDDWDDD